MGGIAPFLYFFSCIVFPFIIGHRTADHALDNTTFGAGKLLVGAASARAVDSTLLLYLFPLLTFLNLFS
jgi:hypothetical protein